MIFKNKIVEIIKIVKNINYFFSMKHTLNNRFTSIVKKNVLKIRKPLINKLKVENYFNLNYTDNKWINIYYSVFGTFDEGFIPISIYHKKIEPVMNSFLLMKTFKDKNFYDKFLLNINTPKTILRRINGLFYDINYKNIALTEELLKEMFNKKEEYIIKPSIDSGSGKAIKKLSFDGRNLNDGQYSFDIKNLLEYSKNFIIQGMVKQHKYFRQFNPSSNNTLRVFTYRSIATDHIHILHVLLRIGSKGNFLDHDNHGGVAIAVNSEGKLNRNATDINGNKYTHFNNINFYEAADVPFIDLVRENAITVAEQIFYGRLLALDYTIDEIGRVLLIEINCIGNGVSQYQYQSGSLFKEYTDEILKYCCSQKTSYSLIQN